MFPNILKTSKKIQIHNKDSKLKCSNYRPISLLSNIDKFLRESCKTTLEFAGKKKRTYLLFSNYVQTKKLTTHALIDLAEKIRQL